MTLAYHLLKSVRDTLRSIPHLVAILSLALSPVLLNVVVGIGPRWPSSYGMALLTGIISSAVFLLWSGTSPVDRPFRLALQSRGLNRRIGLLGTLAILIAYLACDSFFCWSDPPHREYRDRVVGGFLYCEDIEKVIDKAPIKPTVLELLRDAAYDPLQIWPAWTVSLVRVLLVVLWLLTWISVSLLVATVGSAQTSSMPPVSPSGGSAMQGGQMREIRDALASAFDQPSLTQMLKFRLDIDLFDKVAPGAMNNVVFELLQVAEMEGWEAELIEAAYQERTRNPKLRTVYEKYQLAPAAKVGDEPVSLEGLERIIRATNPMLDMGVFWERAARIEPRICRVEMEGRPMGTGFLVGPEAVLTNYHVVQAVIKNETPPTEVELRFGYKRLADGTILSGSVFKLAADWLIDFSPFTDAEAHGEPDTVLPRSDQLDYALLHVQGVPGQQKVDRQTGDQAPLRGWIEVPQTATSIAAGQPLFIAQHPQGEPIKLAIDMDAILGVNGNGTRIRYRTNTEAGSSGSPCFDGCWRILALHHFGDPAYSHPQFNQGIPITLIRRLLEDRGKAAFLGDNPD